MRGKKFFNKITWVVVVVGVCIGGVVTKVPLVYGAECPAVRAVFARGSGSERWKDDNYLAFRDSLDSKLAKSGLSYEFIDLDYPAVGVGIDKLNVTIGALLGSGDAYEFGESVKRGVKNLDKLVNSAECPGTKYVVGGYSQGAMVVSKALPSLRADRLIYAATFGDPKIYLPEGAGIVPAACQGKNLSDYRMYVPDCKAYRGLLGANKPYEPSALTGKVGVWCNKRDVFCSSYFNVTDHLGYISDDLYEDASKVIYNKICAEFGVVNTISSPHDTAIMIDSTWSMAGLISEYKNEALALAEKTLASGGRVALYDYRDYQEGYRAQQRCSFETCSLESFSHGLDEIAVDNGGDDPESVLASSFQIMQELNWKRGATKSIVILTDAGYHEPDFDLNRTTKLDVVRLSKQIDPVNFYVVTTPENAESYRDLTGETDGRVVTTTDDLTELTDYIMERYDSLPRVEENYDGVAPPELSVLSVDDDGSNVIVKFNSSGERTIVTLNDALLGIVSGNSVTITGLDVTRTNVLNLVPVIGDNKGEAVEVDLGANLSIPKSPNTGKFKSRRDDSGRRRGICRVLKAF